MLNYLLLYRSSTQAQKASVALKREGISNQIVRAPKSLSGEGCAYSIRLMSENLHQSLKELHSRGAVPRRIYAITDNGSYEEVPF